MLLTLWIGGYWLLGAWGVGRRALWWLAGAGVLAGLLLMPFLGTERFQRLLDFESGTGFLRLQLWRSAAQMALDHPATGVGPDNFLYAFRNRYLLPAAWQEPNLNHPHNWLLDWWTRLGIPGLILGIGFWFSGLRTLLRNLTSSAVNALRANPGAGPARGKPRRAHAWPHRRELRAARSDDCVGADLLHSAERGVRREEWFAEFTFRTQFMPHVFMVKCRQYSPPA